MTHSSSSTLDGLVVMKATRKDAAAVDIALDVVASVGRRAALDFPVAFLRKISQIPICICVLCSTQRADLSRFFTSHLSARSQSIDM